MASHGQFCAVARTLDVLGGRWTLLVVRELLCGSRRFNDIRRGIPRISRTVLAERLVALAEAGAVAKQDGAHGPEYALTPAGEELAATIGALAAWGQRWLPRRAAAEDIDLEPVLVDMQRRVVPEALPRGPVVLRIEMRGQPRRFLLLRDAEAALCDHNPGFPEPLRLHGSLPALAAWWRGDVELSAARRMGLGLEGQRDLVRAFPRWFARYRFAAVRPAA
ncbi:winged helix-turn-helix transcriptional regulator [Falsiroseomonas sp. HW251]|uniref:winged helix-turn-helix transcriptional regulator n=1 Tax=Falsiroseomonas sp. HW251 TaxID=3390998 RepID=UPI003D321A2A